MHAATFLLQMLLTVLASRGLVPDALDPWRGWVAFKQYARLVDEAPDPGVSVQITPDPKQRVVRLYLLRQVVERDEEWLEPCGGVVCEFTFDATEGPREAWECWSFDASSFERFVDRVELHPQFADLMTHRPVASAVYWEEA